MDLIIYWRFESPGRISDLMLYFHLSHCPYKCTPLNPRYAQLCIVDPVEPFCPKYWYKERVILKVCFCCPNLGVHCRCFTKILLEIHQYFFDYSCCFLHNVINRSNYESCMTDIYAEIQGLEALEIALRRQGYLQNCRLERATAGGTAIGSARF